MAVDKNGSQSKVVTNTYFVGDALSSEKYKGLKIISLVTSENYLFDHEKGIYVMGKTYDDWKNSDEYDYMTEEWNIPANYSQKGREWEKPAAIQIFEDGKPVITDDGITTAKSAGYAVNFGCELVNVLLGPEKATAVSDAVYQP